MVGASTDLRSPRLVVLGDSLGVMWSRSIHSIIERLHIPASFWSVAGETPFFKDPMSVTTSEINGFSTTKERIDFDAARLQLIAQWNPEVVIVACAWSRCDEKLLTSFLDFLEAHCQTVLLIEQPPIVPEISRRDALQYLIWRGVHPRKGVRFFMPSGDVPGDNVDSGRDIVISAIAKKKKCVFVSISDIFLRRSEALVLDGLDVVYLDFMHLSEFGSNLAASRIESAIRKAMKINPLGEE